MKAFMCPSGSGTFQNFLAEPARKAYGWIRMLDVSVQAKSVSCRAVLSAVGAQNGVQTMLNPSMSFQAFLPWESPFTLRKVAVEGFLAFMDTLDV